LKKALIVLACMLLLTSIIGWGWQGWKTYSSSHGGFSILMPGTPSEQRQGMDTALGRIYATDYRVHQKNVVYFASYGDYPPGFVNRSNVNTVLIGVRDGAIGGINGRLLTERFISLDGYPGLEYVAEFTFRNPGDATVKSRIYLKNNRLFQISIFGLRNEVSVAQQNKYLNSFKLSRR